MLANSRSAFSTPQCRMGKALRLDHADARPNAVHASIFGGDRDGDWIHVARHHACIERPGGGDGEDSGAGTDIEDAARMLAFGEAVERDEAAARSGVVRGAEGNARIDLEREPSRRHLAAVMTPMHQEAAGAHRPAKAFRLGHPIPLRKRLDPERAEPRVGRRGLDQLRQPNARRFICVMRRHLDAVMPALEQRHGQDLRTLGGFKSDSDRLSAAGRSLDGRDIGDRLVHCRHDAGLGQAGVANKPRLGTKANSRARAPYRQ